MKRHSASEAKSAAWRERINNTPLRRNLRASLLALLLVLAWSASFIFYSSPERVSVILGEPSSRNIRAPRQITFISEIRTQEARLAAMAQVRDVYSGPDNTVANRQLITLRNVTDYISAVRHDSYADQETKVELLRTLPPLAIAGDAALKMIQLDEAAWQSTVNESLRVLDQIMRDEIRDDQLSEARREVRRLTTRALPAEQQDLVMALVGGLVIPNSLYDAKQTLASREAARNAVEAVPITLRDGESILREGELVTPVAIEKLRVLNLLDTGVRWQDAVSVLLFVIVVVVALSLYVVRSAPLLLVRPRRELLLALTLAVAGVACRVIIPGHILIPYLFPAAAVAMLVAILFDVQIAMVVSAIVAVLVGFAAGGSIELVAYALLGGMIGALAIWRTDQLGTFVRAAVYVALANMAVILAFRLRSSSYDAVGLLQLLGMGIANAALSASLAFVTFSFLGRLFGITTSLQLLELARPTHPLFRQLLIKAPGTYHHCIIISNMAERAAEAIGADALLARVGSYYHDVGKIIRPYFFAENQTNGENPHDSLDPRTSAEIIIAHTLDGLDLAHQYGLPDNICDFIPEHHGTTLVQYFYHRASQENHAEVREDTFRYPGPKPQSRETAIVMLADSIEATVRATHPSTQAELEQMIAKIVQNRLSAGQLDECDLTLRDLEHIRVAFASVLQGVFHPRIQYPQSAQLPAPSPAEGEQRGVAEELALTPIAEGGPRPTAQVVSR
jgi:putative nucleotidyltransferase with HDIG domain